MPRWMLFFAAQLFIGWFFNILAIINRLTFGLTFFRLEVEGLDNLRTAEEPIIITPNHKTYIDHFFIGAIMVRNNLRFLPARAMAADWLFNIRPLGWILKNILGAYPVRRGQGLDISLRDPLRVLLKGHTIVIYPEGRIIYRPVIGDARVGAAYLAQKSGAPIMPVAIRGLEYFTLRSFFFGRRKILIIFGKPFHIPQNEDLALASQKIRQEIATLYSGN